MKKSVLVFALLGGLVAAPAAAQTEGEPSDDGASGAEGTGNTGDAGGAVTGDPVVPPSSGGADSTASSTAPDYGGSDGSDGSASSGSPTVIHVHAGRERDDDDEEAEPQQSPVDPHELEGQSYHHVGVFARGIFAPQFIQNIFVTGGTDALNVGIGAFYNYRRDGLNIIAEVWWAGFYGAGPFHGLNESEFETEWIESELSVVFGSIALMWSIPLTSWLAFEIGFGLGFGGVFGGLYRTEAYPDSATGWNACRAPGDPSVAVGGEQFCDESTANGGEGSYQRRENSPEPYNFSGGVPPLWFWVDLPRVAIRIKPIRQLQIRVEGGFAAYAFYAGGSVALGF